jgi:hypothetical protein
MPFVQVFLPPVEFGDAGWIDGGIDTLIADVREELAHYLQCPASDVLVQTLSADRGSARLAIALIRGRRRPHAEGAVTALADLLRKRLQLDPSAVLVTYESTETSGTDVSSSAPPRGG